ncbi:Pimeloyl-ACP methyl ester carboxylesterase [Streptoalloteichus tenebrarius]|uniref:Pimeloyl-ACP methyl ester carboxylesterase n=1 Tax=Streptoalloteichus tenebrarius (strain ATCC 17920 / DSM 40477 / JCM 4838 / CBS 697.72 / NBRC 16177 / NCIMB 11028 / NRRL B-12390 / A12253. 1 / ISP 5477) TaxID=1933 RepID=A0ABT1HQ69_STRSD|nr:alpha/beta hydrolase [Streptoalloteichus tenebrarius]MCP2257658.1 Pimeloyl-ACP methyl ester carboxylesterase [Streptoalloteichus tenebrarius]
MSTLTSADGTLIDYDRHGRGPAVVFIGGATQYRALDPDTTLAARRLADAGHTAVVYDRRGRGRSGDTPPWSLDREVEDLAALIEAVGGAATLYSSSSGAALALAAATAGLGVNALALYEPPFFAGVDHTDHLAALRSLLAQGRHDDALRYDLTAVIGVPEQVVDGMAQSPTWPAMVAVAPTLVYDLAAVNEINLDPDWRARWAGVTVPTVVFSGDQTFPGMPEAADAVAEAIPSARRRVLPGQGHGPTAEVMASVLLEFPRPAQA